MDGRPTAPSVARLPGRPPTFTLGLNLFAAPADTLRECFQHHDAICTKVGHDLQRP